MYQFEIGEPVKVLDIGLARLRAIMPDAPPNHHGWVHEIDGESGDILVEFPIGDDPIDEHNQIAPYPYREVRPRKGPTRNEYAKSQEGQHRQG